MNWLAENTPRLLLSVLIIGPGLFFVLFPTTSSMPLPDTYLAMRASFSAILLATGLIVTILGKETRAS